MPFPLDRFPFAGIAFLLFIAGIVSTLHPAESQEEGSDASGREAVEVEPLMIRGSDGMEMAGGLEPSSARIGPDQLRQHLHTDVDMVLRKVSGVHVFDAHGIGMSPHISIRGITPERSNSISILEDGVPASVAPYSAASAYFDPNMARMSGIEILKGIDLVRHGPNISGGAVNYMSTPFPSDAVSFVRISYGSYGQLIGHLWHGDTVETERNGKAGYLVEGFYMNHDGYKSIDDIPGFGGADDTGLRRIDPMVKIFWEPPVEMFHRFELKYGRYDLEADESLLGLNDDDFAADPFRRYHASRFGSIDLEADRAHLRHIMAPSEHLEWTTTAYLQRSSSRGSGFHQLRSPVVRGIDDTLHTLSPEGWELADIMRGLRGGTYRIRNYRDEFRMHGVQSGVNAAFEAGEMDHGLEIGLRYHYDEIDTFQRDSDYEQAAGGTIRSVTPGPEGAAGDRVLSSRALAIHARNQMRWRKWAVTPGMRLEWIDQEFRQDQRRNGQGEPHADGGGISVQGGGVSISYDVNPDWSVFLGANRGFTIPSPRSVLHDAVKEETSLDLEAGVHYDDPKRAIHAEAVLFQSRYDDMLVSDHSGTGGSSLSGNFGDFRSRGLELKLMHDYGTARDWKVRIPAQVVLTLTDVDQVGGFRMEDHHEEEEEGHHHNSLYFIPDHLVSGEIGIEYGRFGTYLSMTYSPTVFFEPDPEEDPVGEPAHKAIDRHFLADLSFRYRIRERTVLFGGARNLFDRVYVAADDHYGPRPGAPRHFHAGVEISF